MGTCKQCGKKGFFVFVNSEGLCSECASKASRKVIEESESVKQNTKNSVLNRELTNEMEWVSNQSERNAALFKAMEQYEEENDIDKLIAEYEKALI